MKCERVPHLRNYPVEVIDIANIALQMLELFGVRDVWSPYGDMRDAENPPGAWTRHGHLKQFHHRPD